MHQLRSPARVEAIRLAFYSQRLLRRQSEQQGIIPRFNIPFCLEPSTDQMYLPLLTSTSNLHAETINRLVCQALHGLVPHVQFIITVYYCFWYD